MNNLKIMMVGPSGVGKTSLRKIFFEQANPFEIIQHSLEPTLGMETSYISWEKVISVHDLAGQELNRWLMESSLIFDETDLIICVLDSRDDWHENKKIWDNVVDIQKLVCPKAYLALFFHKIDLMSKENQLKLNNKIENTFNEEHRIMGYLTSIAEDYFLDTFKIFIKILRKSFIHVKNIEFNDVLAVLDILNHFIKKNYVNLFDFPYNIGKNISSTENILQILRKQGYLFINEEENLAQLDKKGQELIDNIKRKFSLQITNHKPRISQSENKKKNQFISYLLLDENAENQLDSIKEIGKIVGSGAAEILGEMLKTEIAIAHPEIINYSQMIQNLKEIGSFVSIMKKSIGSVEGDISIFFPREYVKLLIDLISKNFSERSDLENTELSKIEKETITEIGSTILEGYISSLSKIFDISLSTSKTEMYESKLEDNNISEEYDEIMVIYTPLILTSVNSTLAYIFFIPQASILDFSNRIKI